MHIVPTSTSTFVPTSNGNYRPYVHGNDHGNILELLHTIKIIHWRYYSYRMKFQNALDIIKIYYDTIANQTAGAKRLNITASNFMGDVSIRN